ncbi:hypothetical protein IP93_02941 [Lysobacter ruishenii]|uniref:TonB family protein n=1 Tax=Aerolutibacter ruishenii TaxID=686800 RepID=A0A562LGG0_9GAMM|nr:hypothetical protein IP93_02941 [Lysobacter ruishenii]
MHLMPDRPFAGSSERYDRLVAIAIATLLHVALLMARWQSTAGSGAAPASDGVNEGFLAYFVVRDASPAGAAQAASAEASIELSPQVPDRVAATAETSVDASATAELEKSDEAEPASEATTGQEVASVRSDRKVLYVAALRAAVAQQWKSMHGVEPPSGCVLVVSQRAGGIVVSSEATTCPGDSSVRRGLEAAALMAQPLPYQGFEDVFTGTTVLHFGTDS